MKSNLKPDLLLDSIKEVSSDEIVLTAAKNQTIVVESDASTVTHAIDSNGVLVPLNEGAHNVTKKTLVHPGVFAEVKLILDGDSGLWFTSDSPIESDISSAVGYALVNNRKYVILVARVSPNRFMLLDSSEDDNVIEVSRACSTILNISESVAAFDIYEDQAGTTLATQPFDSATTYYPRVLWQDCEGAKLANNRQELNDGTSDLTVVESDGLFDVYSWQPPSVNGEVTLTWGSLEDIAQGSIQDDAQDVGDPGSVGSVTVEVGTSTSTAPLELLDFVVESKTATTITILFTLSDFATGQLEYGETIAYGNFTTRENSFTYDAHRQTISGLQPDTDYHIRPLSTDQHGNSLIGDDVVVRTDVAAVQTTLPRDDFWINQGWTLEWANTPGPEHVGMDGLDYVDTNEWSNGTAPAFKNVTGSPKATFDIQNAPDGTPALHAHIPAGSSGGENIPSVLIRGHQLGNNPINQRVVFSQEVYYPGEGPTQQQLAQYVGNGHYWGSDASLFPSAGSTRANPEQGWTIRVPVSRSFSGNTPSGSGLLYVYAYLPDDNQIPGKPYHTYTQPDTDRWMLIEVEVQQNAPHTSANGFIKVYIDGQLKTTVGSVRLREKADVVPRGIGMFMSRGNPVKASDSYIRNQRIFTRPV